MCFEMASLIDSSCYLAEEDERVSTGWRLLLSGRPEMKGLGESLRLGVETTRSQSTLSTARQGQDKAEWGADACCPNGHNMWGRRREWYWGRHTNAYLPSRSAGGVQQGMEKAIFTARLSCTQYNNSPSPLLSLLFPIPLDIRLAMAAAGGMRPIPIRKAAAAIEQRVTKRGGPIIAPSLACPIFDASLAHYCFPLCPSPAMSICNGVLQERVPADTVKAALKICSANDIQDMISS